MFRHSIRNKLIFFLLVATIIPSAVSLLITYQYTKESVAQQAVESNSTLLFQGKTNIENYLATIRQATLALYKYNDIMVSLMYPAFQTDEKILAAKQDIFNMLQSLYHSQPGIHQIYFYMEAGKRPFLFVNGLLHDQIAWNTDYKPNLDRPDFSVEPPHKSHNYGMDYKVFVPEKDVLTFHRVLIDALSGQRLGILSFDMNMDMLRSISDQLYTHGEENFFIVDQNGTNVYSSKAEQIGSPLQENWLEHLKGLQDNHSSFRWSDGAFSGINMYDRITGPEIKWTIVKQVQNDFLYRSTRDLTAINTTVVVIFLIIGVAATIFISIRFTQPIKRLIGHINAIETGNLNVKIDAEGSDEIGILSRRFRLMMQTINNLIMREYRLELANKTNELKVLQAQINPHFMNNALQSIGTLALQQGSPEMYSLISSLGKMMRYSMNTTDAVVTLASELDYLKAYLELQERRFGEHLKIRLDLAPEVLQALVPRMTLQPVVENYFKHGFQGTEKYKELAISCFLASGQRLRIEVADNGTGIDPERLEAIKARLSRPHQTSPETGESIGLLNVISRLQLFFSEPTSLQLEPVVPQGLRVIVDIPFWKEVAEDESVNRG